MRLRITAAVSLLLVSCSVDEKKELADFCSNYTADSSVPPDMRRAVATGNAAAKVSSRNKAIDNLLIFTGLLDSTARYFHFKRYAESLGLHDWECENLKPTAEEIAAVKAGFDNFCTVYTEALKQGGDKKAATLAATTATRTVGRTLLFDTPESDAGLVRVTLRRAVLEHDIDWACPSFGPLKSP